MAKRYTEYYTNGSGYTDPTMGEALFNIDRERGTLEEDAPHRKPKYHLAWKSSDAK